MTTGQLGLFNFVDIQFHDYVECYICEESRALLAAMCVAVTSLGAQSKTLWQLGEADGSARVSPLNLGR